MDIAVGIGLILLLCLSITYGIIMDILEIQKIVGQGRSGEFILSRDDCENIYEFFKAKEKERFGAINTISKCEETTSDVELYNMGLHDELEILKGMSVIRVPGGWIYRNYMEQVGGTWQASSVFVPFDNEYLT